MVQQAWVARDLNLAGWEDGVGSGIVDKEVWVPDGDGMLSSMTRMALLAAPLTISGPSPLCELRGGVFQNTWRPMP